MLIVTGLFLVCIQIVQGQGGVCTERCIWCDGDRCEACFHGYTGLNCSKISTRCPPHCKDNKCVDVICIQCEEGWHGVSCDKPCHPDCRDNRCSQITGECYDDSPYHCVVCVCTHYCKQYCDPPDDRDYSSGEEKEVMATEWIICIAGASIALVVACFCCLVKRGGKTEKMKDTSMVVVPSAPALLPDQQPNTFTSSNRTYSHVSPGNGCQDSENIMTSPSNSQWCPSNSQSSSRPTLDDVTTHVINAEIPAPTYGHDREPPPSYDSLFKPTVPPSSA